MIITFSFNIPLLYNSNLNLYVFIKYNIRITSVPYDQEKIDYIDSRTRIYYTQDLALQEVKNKFNTILERINKPLRGEVYG